MKLFGKQAPPEQGDAGDENARGRAGAPYLAMAFFCERIDENDRGVKSFINAMDTLRFAVEEGKSISDYAWEAMLAIEVTFGGYRGAIELTMIQTEVATGEQEQGLNQTVNTEDFPGMLSISYSINVKIAFKRAGDYRYEFFVNGTKRAETCLRVLPT